MLDTIRVVTARPLTHGMLSRELVRLDKGITVRVAADGMHLRSAECSLPRVLYGHNGCVLRDQAELDAAVALFCGALDELIQGVRPGDLAVRRADLCWNFDRAARPVILAHSETRVPGIQASPSLHRSGTGISWLGYRSQLGVKFYDKCRQMRCDGSVLRAEIMLQGFQLSSRLPREDWRDWQRCWNAFAAFLSTIPPVVAPATASSWLTAIAPEPIEIRRRILARLPSTPRRTYNQRARDLEAAAAVVQDGCFHWSS